MAKLVVVITSQINRGHEVGEAWQGANAPGVTFIEGHGLRRIQEKSRSIEVPPGTFSFLEIIRQAEVSSMIIFSVVDSLDTAKTLIDVAQQILGNFSELDTGIAFVTDIEFAVGFDKR